MSSVNLVSYRQGPISPQHCLVLMEMTARVPMWGKATKGAGKADAAAQH